MTSTARPQHPARPLVWQVPSSRWLGDALLRLAIVTVLLGSLGVTVGRLLQPAAGWVELWLAGLLVAFIPALLESFVWFRRQTIRVELTGNSESTRLQLIQARGERLELPGSEVSAVLGIGGKSWGGGDEQVWKSTVIIAEQVVSRVALAGDENRALYQALLDRCPFAWGYSFPGRLEPPAEVADRTHANAPDQALGRLRRQIRVAALRALGLGLLTLVATLGLLIVIVVAGGLSTSLVWLLLVGWSGLSNLSLAGELFSQSQSIAAVQEQLREQG